MEACRRAVEDAGIEPQSVDGLLVKYPTSQPRAMYGQRLATALGLEPRVGGGWDQGGASNIALIAFACMAIDAGLCETALVTFADNPKSGSRAKYARPHGVDGGAYGWFGNVGAYAMIARRHCEEFGTSPEQLGEIVRACRAHGASNPDAQLRKPVTLEDYLASPWVVDPLRRDDCCLISDGGAAVVVMSRDRAQRARVPAPVLILGFGMANTPSDTHLRGDLTRTNASAAAAVAFEMAGVRPNDVDVAELYDCFSIVPLITLEDYGFCRKGEGGHFVMDQGVSLRGRLPLNTSGGLLSETGMPGMQHVLEGVRQVRGTAVNQAPAADVVLVSNQGGTMQTHATLVLGR